MFRKFFIWLTKSLIVIILTAFIFSSLALNLPGFVKGVFKDIFQHADTNSQKEVVNQLSYVCSDLDDKNIQSTQEELSKRGITIDFKKLGTLCKSYSNGTISQNEFFFKTIETTLPDKIELPKGTVFEKYNQAINFAAQNKIIYTTVLLVLILFLYFLAGNHALFLATLADISFSIGTLILVPYIMIIAYTKIVGIDTTPVLSTIFGGGVDLGVKAIMSLILLMISRTYTTFLIALGVGLSLIGVVGKIYSHRLKKKEEEPIKSKKIKSDDEELEEELDKKSKEKEKNMKEILDELEDVQKKKKS